MAKSENNLTAVFTDTANAIRAKKSTEALIEPRDFADEISSIETGIEPTGTTYIYSNGTHDVTNYAQANVNISTSVNQNIIEVNVLDNNSPYLSDYVPIIEMQNNVYYYAEMVDSDIQVFVDEFINTEEELRAALEDSSKYPAYVSVHSGYLDITVALKVLNRESEDYSKFSVSLPSGRWTLVTLVGTSMDSSELESVFNDIYSQGVRFVDDFGHFLGYAEVSFECKEAS